MQNPFRYFNSSPEAIRLAVMMYIRYPLSLRQVEELLFKRSIDICDETVTVEARDVLTPVHNWFADGFDTADLKEAKALLNELG